VLAQIAFTAGWTAISSLIGYYKALYGPHMLLHLNLAYFLPSLPTLILQSVWDARLDGKYGIAKAATVRLCLGMWTLLLSMCALLLEVLVSCLQLYTLSAGLGGSALVCAIYPFYETSRTVLLGLVSLLGLCNSVAFSTSYQVVTHFGTSNSVALTTGKGVQLGLMPESLECFCMLHGIAAAGIVDPRNALCVTASHASIQNASTDHTAQM
jgi:magnesium-transporting ATPase (P-type)